MVEDVDVDVQVREFIRDAVPDWDDPVKLNARFKAFSGQPCDWEPLLNFWTDLILNVARRFDFLILSPSRIINSWFTSAGLAPLCLPQVLFHMYKAGHLLRINDLPDPTTPHLSQLFNRILCLSRSLSPDHLLNHSLILPVLLQEKAAHVVEALSEIHWTASCVVTMNKFESLFSQHSEARVVLSYLSGQGKAKYISLKKNAHLMEGVKLSLSSAPVSSISSLDYDVLQLVSTVQEFQQQLHVIDSQFQRLRQTALAALRSGDRSIALRNARLLKLASGRRDKLALFLNRVEGVLHAVFDAETTKKVSEAMRIGARSIKENRINIEEVQSCLQEVDELMNSQEKVNETLGINADKDDVDVNEELLELEMQIRVEGLLVSAPDFAGSSKRNSDNEAGSEDLLSSAMVGLKLKDNTEELCFEGAASPRNLVGLES